MKTRAKTGGELGANGEFYKGGQFINTVPENPKKEGSTPKKARKVQVEPFVWVVDTRTPILSLVGGQAKYIDRNDWRKGIEPFAAGVAYYGNERNGKTIQEWCDLFNAGERWM